ncbi:hypothetical protein FNH05_25795 [Amycolatopsis rhizosphaerae]|uniref:IucA/IucC family siderophore biosynthesis protein n=1 Tax=Amycolatopsis rhizosphaerae TaxID=2053003 RepID=A0A558BHX4_9PSEU|nr:IucA/IucC family protein [Amycolatopsis rhizosphaerae]TVT36095.1 hypothetical protein FNH05_25795 [Amycolatopsis rhizosphaerae]
MTATALVTPAVAQADLVSAHTLLGCLVREIAAPEGQVELGEGTLSLRLPHRDVLLRAEVTRRSTVDAHRFAGPVLRRLPGGDWAELGLDALIELAAAELAARTGTVNDEFAGQIRASRDTLADILATRPTAPARPVSGAASAYLDSEQGLIDGHPRHPAPKWRSGDRGHWRGHAPETRTAFPLRWLAVPGEFVHDHGDFDAHAATSRLLGGARLPDGHRAVPVHPWQYELLTRDPELGPVLSAALAEGAVRDLGPAGPAFHPTASVRTLYQPEADLFLKTSLHVRITNCLRKNAAYELAGAVALTGLLAGPVTEVTARHPGFGLLAEPAARGVALPERYGTGAQRRQLLEGLGTIVRDGLGEHVPPGGQIHLAATLAAARPDPAGTRTRLADLAAQVDPADWAARWWARYLALLVPPVLRLWAVHGVVLEPHPQNVLVVLDPGRLPVAVLARDLEGTKLLTPRHHATLAGLPGEVARALAYDSERGWRRIAYCLFVNHLTEVAGALADLVPSVPGFEDTLWAALADLLAEVSAELGHPPRLRALLNGVPLPAKANLHTRWDRRADRDAGYVPFAHPLGRSLAEAVR